jgi:integrase
VTGFSWKHEPGDRVLACGTRVIATEENAVFIKDGRIIGEEKNDRRLDVTVRFAPALRGEKPRPKRNGKHPDDAIIETWKKQRATTDHIANEGDRAWTLFKVVTNAKPLSECDRDDARKLVQVLFAQGKKRATVQKLLNHLNSAVNIAIDDKKLRFNPFSRALPKRRKGEPSDALQRLPMDEEDMALVRAHLHTFEAAERLLWCLLATTGMRRGEAWHIQREHVELGIRYVIVGSKSDASERRVPLPAAFLERYPGKITSPLFTETPKNLGKRLLRRIRALGIMDPAKVLHSLRHRAQDRLRAHGCPEDVREWLLGHEQVTVADGYGKGPPVTVLKPWADLIGLGPSMDDRVASYPLPEQMVASEFGSPLHRVEPGTQH